MAARKVVDGGEALLQTLYSAVALLVVLAACVDLCDAATAVDVYRLIQYDLSGAPFGSRRAALNHHAGVPPFPPTADLSRTAVVLTARHLDLDFLRDCVVNKRQLGGLLILLPRELGGREAGEAGDGDGSSPTAILRNVLTGLEQLLLHSNLPFPVYFAFEDDKIDSILDEVKNNDSSGQPATATTGGYKFIVPTPEPKKFASPALTNIQGWLPGLRVDGDASQLPTIAIVASYDTFGAAPALAEGSDSNGSGVAALLEIARLFYRLYSDPKTRGSYNLLFGLTSGGPYNYNGTLKWLRGFDQRLRESIDYAICLNSVGSWDDELWLHVSKPPENAYIKHIHESMSDVAEELGARIGIKHKKINISDSRVAWEHEQFSRLRITAATLSELSSAPELLEHTGGLSDRRVFVNEMGVARVVKLVAESLARHIYRQKGKNVEIFSDDSSLDVSPSYIRLWLDLLSRTPRVAPFLPKNDQLILALKKELSDHTVDVNVQHEVLDGIFTFYDVTKGKLSIYQVASVTFDLLLLLALGSYLILLFSFLVITTRGLDDLISIFRRPPSRKLKTA